ncbi:hypothetical protein FE257_006380 [Aspergillus nanangensis]|uniref:Enoyl reductase (ER) domain-containing protein n=1 Tax=Aspergillus nanangensis TaxID=2582783 RepID=A0AAD4CZA5_ASPNN|nr:hypothetical protein FE257_006380 [Aspergillus nanangensis]
MSSPNVQYLVHSQGGPLAATTSDKPTISHPTELLIRIKSIAINPADIKMIDKGLRVTSWPIVPGLDGAGIVEAIGDDVTNFRVGDEVLAMCASSNRSASFQTFAVVKETMVAKKPPSWSFEEASSLGVCYLTGILALGIGIGTALQFLPDGPQTGFSPSSVLILGGSSALGGAVIQLLRLAVPDCMVLVTSSPRHHVRLTSRLGAHRAFDRHSASIVEDVRSASPGARGVDAIVDAVGAGSTERHVFDILDADGPKRYAQVWTGDPEIEVPSGVDSVMFKGADLPRLQGGKNIMLALRTLLEEGKYQLPVPVHKVGGLEEGLDLMRQGVSGAKLVVTV